MMLKTTTILALLLLSTGAANAFEQTTPATGQADAVTIPGIEVKPEVLQKGAGVELTVPGAIGGQASGKGTEINIPGLGSLGVLPKLDFGLELLYGATDQGTAAGETEQQKSLQPDDVTVHGAVKKSF